MTRDNVCTYVNARVYPRPDKICRLAKALEVSVAELIPKSAMLASIDEQPAMDTRLTDKPGMVWLRIAAEVPLALALEIMDRIRKAGGGNGEMRPA